MGWACRTGELLLRPVGSGLPRSLWWLPALSGCTARGWGAIGRGLGALWVGGAFVQYAQPLASGSRPSWSRPTRAHLSQFWAVLASNHDHRAPAQMAGRERRGQTCDGDSGMRRKNPGLTPARPGVHSADINGPGVNVPSGDRWNPAVSCQARSPDSGLMSAPWTPTPPSCLTPKPPSPPGPPARPRFPPERVPQNS